ncbi:MAG TPA: CmcI family methyltransferase, partial [Zoogloea sp.]|nr:CmcI family methyltransferase [Zoogloea sp.]
MKSLSEQFQDEVAENISALSGDELLHSMTSQWVNRSAANKYTYNFRWLGRPIIQYPQDILAMQELIWAVRPDLIIETGIAHGGSLAFSASMLALLDLSDAIESGQQLDPR